MAGSGPSISGATGGGALRGIGETFQPDLNTGAAHVTLPIEVPPGRAQLQPNLVLAYTSGHGNGAFGMGWSLSVPTVSRKTANGTPRYAGEDTFVLVGAEDLVEVGRTQPSPGELTVAYRPRTEGLHARIEHHVGRTAGDHWI